MAKAVILDTDAAFESLKKTKSYVETARSFGVSSSTLARCLKRKGYDVGFMTRSLIDQDTLDKAKQLYVEGYSLDEIKSRLGGKSFSVSGIFKKLRGSGFEGRRQAPKLALDSDQIEQLEAGIKAGKSHVEMARAFGVTQNALRRFIKSSWSPCFKNYEIYAASFAKGLENKQHFEDFCRAKGWSLDAVSKALKADQRLNRLALSAVYAAGSPPFCCFCLKSVEPSEKNRSKRVRERVCFYSQKCSECRLLMYGIGAAKTIDQIAARRMKEMCRNARSRALKARFDFDIDEQWVQEQIDRQGSVCFWSGLPLEFKGRASGVGKGDFSSRLGSPSLDRRDSNKGYTKDNVVVARYEVNVAKSCLTEDQFLGMCRSVAARFSGKDAT